MKFIKENTVFGYKKWWKTISISFPKSSEAIHINFSTNLYRILWQGGFTLNRLFFVLFSREITKKSENTVFGYKTKKNSKKILLLKTLEVDYITIPPFFLTTSHFGRIYSQKHIFLYRFMHKSWKNTKYIFWLQKVVKIWTWWHFQMRDPKLA